MQIQHLNPGAYKLVSQSYEINQKGKRIDKSQYKCRLRPCRSKNGKFGEVGMRLHLKRNHMEKGSWERIKKVISLILKTERASKGIQKRRDGSQQPKQGLTRSQQRSTDLIKTVLQAILDRKPIPDALSDDEDETGPDEDTGTEDKDVAVPDNQPTGNAQSRSHIQYDDVYFLSHIAAEYGISSTDDDDNDNNDVQSPAGQGIDRNDGTYTSVDNLIDTRVIGAKNDDANQLHYAYDSPDVLAENIRQAASTVIEADQCDANGFVYASPDQLYHDADVGMYKPGNMERYAGFDSGGFVAADCFNLDSYVEMINSAVDRSLARLDRDRHNSAACSRLRDQGPIMERILKSVTPPSTLTADEYLDAYSECWRSDEMEIPLEQKFEGSRAIIIANIADARRILEHGSPRLPIYIPAELNNLQFPAVTVEQYLDYLNVFPELDAMVYDREASDYDRTEDTNDCTPSRDTKDGLPDQTGQEEESGDRQHWPVKLEMEKALELFRTPDRFLTNCLSLGVYRSDSEPPCFRGLTRYTLLRHIDLSNGVGKKRHFQKSDLLGCVSFQILANGGTYSLPHWDHHGTITSIFAEAGNKLWVTWPRMTHADLTQWAQDESDYPSGTPFAVFMKPGDTLIQPPGTVHAPYSPDGDALMTGHMFWDAGNMLEVMRLSLLEREYTWVTNEPPAKDFSFYMDHILEMWNKQKHWTFGDQAQKYRLQMLLKIWKDAKGCKCRTSCGPRCPCVQANTPCLSSCHGTYEKTMDCGN